MQKILENRMLISVSLSVVLTFVFVFAVAYGVTTISTNITTAGTLTIATSVNGPLQANAGVVSATTTLTTMYGGTGLTDGGLKASFIPFGAGTSAFATSTYLSFTSPILTATFASTTAFTSGIASTTSLVVGGDSTNGTIAGIVHGACSIAATTITASTTKSINCTSANGVRINDHVFVTPVSLYSNLIVTGASSTVADTIQVSIFNLGISTTTTATIAAGTWYWMAIR